MKRLINLKIKDDKCFKWCHIRFINPINSHPERINKQDEKIASTLDCEGINPIQDGIFWGCSRMGGRGGFMTPLPKIHQTYPTMMKLGTVIPYLRKIKKMYKSHDTSVELS